MNLYGTDEELEEFNQLIKNPQVERNLYAMALIIEEIKRHVEVLERERQASQDRFDVGEITRTDVAQSEARLAQSEADLAAAQAQLSVSRANYAAVVGQAPANLETPPDLPGVPTDFDAALDVALAENPGLIAAEYNLRGAEARVATLAPWGRQMLLRTADALRPGDPRVAVGDGLRNVGIDHRRYLPLRQHRVHPRAGQPRGRASRGCA